MNKKITTLVLILGLLATIKVEAMHRKQGEMEGDYRHSTPSSSTKADPRSAADNLVNYFQDSTRNKGNQEKYKAIKESDRLEIKSLGLKVEDLEEQVETKLIEFRNMQDTIDKQNLEIKRHNSEIKSKNSEITEQREAFNQQRDYFNQQRENLTQNLTNLHREFERLQYDNNHYKMKNLELQADYVEASNHHAGLAEALDQKSEKNTRYKQGLKDIRLARTKDSFTDELVEATEQITENKKENKAQVKGMLESAINAGTFKVGKKMIKQFNPEYSDSNDSSDSDIQKSNTKTKKTKEYLKSKKVPTSKKMVEFANETEEEDLDKARSTGFLDRVKQMTLSKKLLPSDKENRFNDMVTKYAEKKNMNASDIQLKVSDFNEAPSSDESGSESEVVKAIRILGLETKQPESTQKMQDQNDSSAVQESSLNQNLQQTTGIGTPRTSVEQNVQHAKQ